MNSCIFTPILRLACCGLSLGLFILIAGCGGGRARSVEHADVTGKVLFQGKPLPGGTVSFVAVNGGFANTVPIEESGNYKVSSPVGEVRIGVDNRMLRTKGEAPKESKTLREKMEPEAQKDQPSKGPLKGRYVRIPTSYAEPSTSGLKYTVKPGAQTHDIELSADAPDAPKRR
jgi:hypothetical protein